MAKCEYCQVDLGRGQGITVTATQGGWRGKKLNFCDCREMMLWDCSGPDPQYLGHQGFNLAQDLWRVNSRREVTKQKVSLG